MSRIQDRALCGCVQAWGHVGPCLGVWQPELGSVWLHLSRGAWGPRLCVQKSGSGAEMGCCTIHESFGAGLESKKLEKHWHRGNNICFCIIVKN